MNEVTDTRRVFRPGLIPTLVTLALLPLLIALGLWQLGRWEYKRELEAAYAEAADPVPADYVDGDDSDRFRPVRARGRYEGDSQFLVDNMVRDGRNGFYVITPFRLVDGRLLLVNRGWIPQDARRRPLVDVGVGGETRSIDGRVGGLPVAGLELAAGGENSTGNWPSVRQFPDLEELSEALGEPVMPWVLLLSPQTEAGFARDWQPGGLPASRHLGYAVQWFALATALAAIYLIVNWRRRPAGSE